MNKALFLFIVFFAVSTFAQVEFPMGSKIVNVTKDPYFAKGDGKNDDTEAIQKALNDHPDGDYIIYLPPPPPPPDEPPPPLNEDQLLWPLFVELARDA